ncbi:MAG: hypothetical protein K2R98_19765 [Gemmataceae bacterium]|nr:hypothetical protein [Gemmataceae bacterium]
MSYSSFTLASFCRAFQVGVRDHALFDSVGSIAPEPWLQQALENGQDLAVTSEKARSEFIVAPILMTCRMLVGHDLRIFSGATLDVDPARGLNGEIDFILARSESSYVFQTPLMVILEAKKHDIEEGLGQCAAQMLGARIYNEREGKPVPYVYGCVTNGHSWQFVKLQGAELQIHPELIPIQELPKILWFVVECIQDVDRESAAIATA